jgi:hypothetical protein
VKPRLFFDPTIEQVRAIHADSVHDRSTDTPRDHGPGDSPQVRMNPQYPRPSWNPKSFVIR